MCVRACARVRVCVRFCLLHNSVCTLLLDSPEVDNRNMRYGMLNEHKSVIGETKAFDGSTLFLPIELPQKVLFDQ